MLDWSARLLEDRTGAGVADWNRRVRDTGIDSEPVLRSWLAAQGVTGYGQMLLVMERFGYPEFLLASADDLVDGQYADRAALRAIFDRIVVVSAALGEFHVQARKTYVSLVTPRRTFAIVRPTTRKRVDLGLRLADVPPGGRLEPARSLGNDDIRLRIGLAAPDEVDDEVVDWLRRAYEENSR
jgi:hypothetical protein